jgi:hypothetical protein
MCNGNGLEALTLRALLALYISTTTQVRGEVLTLLALLALLVLLATLQVGGDVLTLLALLALLALYISTTLQVGGEVLTAGDLRVRLEVLALFALLAVLVQKVQILDCRRPACAPRGARFTCFTGTKKKVQILTLRATRGYFGCGDR